MECSSAQSFPYLFSEDDDAVTPTPRIVPLAGPVEVRRWRSRRRRRPLAPPRAAVPRALQLPLAAVRVLGAGPCAHPLGRDRQLLVRPPHGALPPGRMVWAAVSCGAQACCAPAGEGGGGGEGGAAVGDGADAGVTGPRARRRARLLEAAGA